MRFLLVVVIMLVLVSSASAVSPEPLDDACGYSTPVTSITVISSRDGDSYTINDAALLARLDNATGREAPNVRGEWVETIRIQPGNAVAEVYYYADASLPFRLRCEATGRIMRTDDDFFTCHLLGDCS